MLTCPGVAGARRRAHTHTPHGLATHDCHCVVAQGATLFPEDAPEAKKALARWMVAFARALRIHFQPEVTLESELATILTPKELEMLKAAPHRPVKAIHAMSQVRGALTCVVVLRVIGLATAGPSDVFPPQAVAQLASPFQQSVHG